MPVAWFISFLQKRSHDTRGQKGVICFGLIVSTFGFGEHLLPPCASSPKIIPEQAS